MKSGWAKWVFSAALMLCLGGIVLMCAEGKTIIRWTAEVANPRNNESLYLEARAGGVLFIDGEGKLYGTDIRALIEGQRMVVNDVTDVIIGGGVTEIGYDAFCGWEALRTLYIGPNVRTIGNGAVRECPSLAYVFVPSGLARAGKDFLYSCNRCLVITDGPAADLPKMKNVSKKNVRENVDSFAALQAACEADGELPGILEQWWP